MSHDILVVGGAGYLGSLVAEALPDCTVYDALLYRREYTSLRRFVRGDVRDREKLLPELDWADCVVWLAAIVGDAACALDPATALEVNVEAAGYAAEIFDGPFIFTSTASVYGRTEGEADEEGYGERPLSLYAETKLRAEELVWNKGKKPLILRLGTLHGLSPRMRFDLAVNAMARDAALLRKVRVFGGGQHRPLLAVSDAAELIARLARDPDSWESGVYNVACENLTMEALGDLVAKEIGAVVTTLEAQAEDRRDYSLDVRRAVADLGFRGCVGATISAKSVSALVKSGRLRDPWDPAYTNAFALKEGGWKGRD